MGISNGQGIYIYMYECLCVTACCIGNGYVIVTAAKWGNINRLCATSVTPCISLCTIWQCCKAQISTVANSGVRRKGYARRLAAATNSYIYTVGHVVCTCNSHLHLVVTA